MASHVFHKLVFSERLNMKMASWGYFVSLADSSGEPAAHPGFAFAVVPGGFRSEFEVGHATSCDEVASVVKNPPMGCASS